MKKTNRKKSLQIGLATLSTITMLSGCGTKKPTTNYDQNNNDMKKIEYLLKTNERTYEIEKILEISDKLNKDLKENDLLGELKEINGVKYYDYNVNNIEFLNLDNYTFDEMIIFGENIEKFTNDQKLFFRAYLNNWLYHNDLLINYENLERVIISLETRDEFVPLQEDGNDGLYIIETKKMLEEQSNQDLVDYEIVENYYNISEEAAKDITTLIYNMPTPGFMVKEVTDEKIPGLGPEDYIPILNEQIKNSTKVIRPMNWAYYEDTLNKEEEPTSSKSKIKNRK